MFDALYQNEEKESKSHKINHPLIIQLLKSTKSHESLDKNETSDLSKLLILRILIDQNKKTWIFTFC